MTAAQVLAVAGTFLATYIFFQGLGPRDRALFFSRDEKIAWDANLRQRLGDWLVVTGIFGTLTSFATYLFLLGSTKLFGWFALSTGITIALSAPVTKILTRAITKEPRVRALLSRNDQVSSVIASLFWSDTPEGRRCAFIVKWVSYAIILAVIWLECTVFVDLTFWLLGYTEGGDVAIASWRFAALLLVAFSIIFFVLRYGIRGFVFADLFHGPLIGLAAICVLGGTLWLTIGTSAAADLTTLAAPLLVEPVPVLGVQPGWIFAAHVLVLNLFQITCTEHHWFRMWLFGEKELQRQLPGTAITGAVWLLMLPVGFFAFVLAGQPGEPAIASLVANLGKLSAIFGLVFWIGATAALFSTADMQIYSALLVSRFSPKTGELRALTLSTWRSFFWAAGLATVFAAAYTGVRAAAFPLEKIIFVIVPLCVVLLPAFLHYWWGREVRSWVLILSLLGYVAMAGWGFSVERMNFTATLSAVFVPVIVACVTWFFVPGRDVARR